MAEEVSLPRSAWKRDDIRAKRMAALVASDLSREELLEKVADLETALYPFAYTLGSIGEKAWRGTTVTSKLFPMLDDDGKFTVRSGVTEEAVATIPENELHEREYDEHDGMTIEDGTQLSDLFTLMWVHQQGPGAYINCGQIVMGDVRYARQLIFPKADKSPESEKT